MALNTVTIPGLTSVEMLHWSQYIQQISGIHLDSTKTYLIQTRLGSLLRKTKSTTWSELLSKIRNDVTGQLRNELINSIATNETSFFRDIAPFELLKNKLIPDLIDRRAKEGYKRIPIRIFSAACSTGQEVYSAIILLKELLGDLNGYDILVTGVDISDRAISQASKGIFSSMEVARGLSPDRLSRFFNALPKGYKVKDEYRSLANFKKANLLAPILPFNEYDIVFCRNVAIYFEAETRRKLFQGICNMLKSEGSLIVGSTETIAMMNDTLNAAYHHNTVYYQKSDAHVSAGIHSASKQNQFNTFFQPNQKHNSIV